MLTIFNGSFKDFSFERGFELRLSLSECQKSINMFNTFIFLGKKRQFTWWRFFILNPPYPQFLFFFKNRYIYYNLLFFISRTYTLGFLLNLSPFFPPLSIIILFNFYFRCTTCILNILLNKYITKQDYKCLYHWISTNSSSIKFSYWN